MYKHFKLEKLDQKDAVLCSLTNPIQFKLKNSK